MFRSKTTTQFEATVVGSGTVIEGRIAGKGRVQIDGQVDGSVDVQGEVSVGPRGVVQGELTTDELAVGGRVQGKINVRGHLRVLAGGSVQGEVRYASLQIDRGGVLGGTATHGDEAVSVGDADVKHAPPALPHGAPAVS